MFEFVRNNILGRDKVKGIPAAFMVVCGVAVLVVSMTDGEVTAHRVNLLPIILGAIFILFGMTVCYRNRRCIQ